MSAKHSTEPRRRAVAQLAEMVGVSAGELTATLRSWREATGWDICHIQPERIRVVTDTYRSLDARPPVPRRAVAGGRPFDPGI